MGDFNIDMTNNITNTILSDRLSTVMIGKITYNAYIQTVECPTRFQENSIPSLIDHCWTNCINRLAEVSNINMGNYDHNIIQTRIRAKNIIVGNCYIRKRCLKITSQH